LTAGSPSPAILRLAQSFVVLLGIALAGTRFGELHVVLDNLSNFPLHFAAAFLACFLVLAIAGSRRWAFLAATGLTASLVPVVPWYFPATEPQPSADANIVEILVSNVYVDNPEHAKLIRLIEAELPDVVGLIEVNSRWLRELESLRSKYPFHFEVPDEATIGLALYSRLPLSNARILRVGETGTPAIAATMELPDGEIEIILAHPLSPIDADYARHRNAQFLALGRYVRGLNRPVVLAGDLNATMWNRNYRKFAELGRLHNARAGHGIGPTWPAVPLLGVPIDHILGTAPIRFRNFHVRESVGSDHLPVSAEFSLR